MQPLDVAVFGPMKRHWREKVLSAWKEECERKGENFATIPKQVFPTLLKELLESKDYGPAIRSGFETTGLYPFSMEKALSKLPVEVEEREVESAVQRTLLNTLSNMRYNAPANKAAARPKRSERLPPGASYTCGPEKVVRPSGDGDSSNSESDSSSSSESEDEGEEETRRTWLRLWTALRRTTRTRTTLLSPRVELQWSTQSSPLLLLCTRTSGMSARSRTRRRSLKLRKVTTTSSSASWRGSKTTTLSSGPCDRTF
jgi:hypothetical protein